MAILIKRALLPDDDGFACLGRLNGSVRVCHKKDLTSPQASVVLATEDNDLVLLRMDFQDVVFKFECFGLIPEKILSVPWPEVSKVGIVDGWHTIKCLFRFEWERPAFPGEIPSNWEQIKRSRGVRSKIDHNLTAVGVSMVGIMFWDLEGDAPVSLMFSHDDDPSVIRLTSEKGEINNLTRECECVNVVDAGQWVSECRRWLESIKSQAS